MGHSTDAEKLAGVLNRASQQGKAGFCRMLWDNQPGDVQAELRPFLSAVALETIEAESA